MHFLERFTRGQFSFTRTEAYRGAARAKPKRAH
jgi:hypothetical protein